MTEIHNHTYDEIIVGQQAVFKKTLTDDLIAMFATVSGDLNPIHLDDAFAAQTVFQSRVGHGAWIGSLVSAAIGMHLPGPGAIYRRQDLAFKEPVRIGDEVTVLLEVTEKKDRLKLLTIACTVTNQTGKTIARGLAEVIAPTEKLNAFNVNAPLFQRV